MQTFDFHAAYDGYASPAYPKRAVDPRLTVVSTSDSSGYGLSQFALFTFDTEQFPFERRIIR